MTANEGGGSLDHQRAFAGVDEFYRITATSFHDHFVPNHFVPSFGHFVPYRSKIIKTLSNRGLFEFKLNEIVMTMIKVKGKKSDDVVMTKRGHASA